ncbi:MAG: Ppx/GppA phosphatase family protein [Spirulinaceae cyanobacterium]
MVNSILSVKANNSNIPVSISQENCVIAAIDIGTNSIHMVAVKVDLTLPAFTIIAKEKDTVRLGNRDPKTGNLTPDGIKRALATLKRCQDLAESLQAIKVIAVATSAVREAPNGQDFINEVKEKLGLAINLISGQEEARRIYLGVLSGMEFDNRPHAIIDIGGGSTELILGDGHAANFLTSVKIGAVRLSQKLVKNDPLTDQDFLYLQAYIQGRLERPITELLDVDLAGEELKLVGTSGTIEALATIHAKDKLGYTPDPLNGYTFSRKDLEELVEDLAKKDYKKRLEVSGMQEKRAEIIVPGAMILLEAMKMLQVKSIRICERALREGVIVDWMLTHKLIENRLRYQSEIRERSVIKIARKYQVDLSYAERVANLALSIFDQTQNVLHEWTEEERELLWAAAMLHNCGLYVSHSSHHKHSYYLIRNGELLGYTEMELEAIANLARYYRKSKPKKKHQPYNDFLNDKYRLIVSQISPMLRLATALDRRKIGAVSQVKCEYNSKKKELLLSITPTYAEDDCSSELWSVEDKKVVFEEEYGIKIASTINDA